MENQIKKAILSSLIQFNFLILSSVAGAQAFDVAVQAGDRLLVRGLDVQISLVANSTPQLRVLGVDNGPTPESYRIEKKDKLITISMNGYESKRDWKESLAKKMDRKRILEISGPPLPVDIQSRMGVVNLNRWNQEVNVSLVQGKVVSQQGKDLKVNLNKGEVSVSDHQGPWKIQMNSGTVTLKNITGDGEINLMQGQITAEKVVGHSTLTTHSASAKVLQSKGTLQIDNQKAALTITNFQGRVDGQTGDGPVTVAVALDSEVNLKSKSGRLQVQFPEGGGAFLNANTAEGELFLPGDLKAQKQGSEKFFRGRLRGESQRISVTARSQEGSIILKY